MRTKRFDLSKLLAAVALCLSLSSLGATPAAAQNTNNGNTSAAREERRDDDRRDTARTAADREEDRDWGWLGLLGLAGLLGLMPRKRVPVVVNNEPRDRR